MKKLKFLFAVIIVSALSSVQAQEVTILPDWAPADQTDARYYYIPDIETYYDVRNKTFVYQDNGQWVKSETIPPAHRSFDLKTGEKIVITDDAEPYGDFEKMKVKYKKGYKGDKDVKVKIKDDKIKIKEK